MNIRLEQFKKMKLDYRPNWLEEAEAVQAAILPHHACWIEAVLSEYDGKKHFERFEVVLTDDPLRITISYESYAKHYSIRASLIFEHLDNRTVSGFFDKVERPNNIGKPSAKKIEEWIAYIKQVYNLAKAKSHENGIEKAKFLESIKGLDVKWWGTRGEVIKNGIKYSFEVGKEYITQKIEVHYSVRDTLQNFLALSDNKYKGAEE